MHGLHWWRTGEGGTCIGSLTRDHCHDDHLVNTLVNPHRCSWSGQPCSGQPLVNHWSTSLWWFRQPGAGARRFATLTFSKASFSCDHWLTVCTCHWLGVSGHWLPQGTKNCKAWQVWPGGLMGTVHIARLRVFGILWSVQCSCICTSRAAGTVSHGCFRRLLVALSG